MRFPNPFSIERTKATFPVADTHSVSKVGQKHE